MATLQDIANECGCNKSTISRALNGNPKISPEVRDKVQEVARRLGYKVNPVARTLATGKTQAIWLIAGSMESPVERRIAQEASRILEREGYWLHILLYHYREDALIRILEHLNLRMADGAILIPSFSQSDAIGILENRINQGTPVVFADRYYEGLNVDRVTFEPEQEIGCVVDACIADGAQGVLNLFRKHNAMATRQHEVLAKIAGQAGIPCWTEETLDKMGGVEKLAVIAGGYSRVRDFVNPRLDLFEPYRLVYGTLDGWTDSYRPAEKVFVSERDYKAMAEAICKLILERVQGVDGGAESVAISTAGIGVVCD